MLPHWARAGMTFTDFYLAWCTSRNSMQDLHALVELNACESRLSRGHRNAQLATLMDVSGMTM